MALVDTGLVVRYYLDEAASGLLPPNDALDESGVGADFDLAYTQESTNLRYNEISGNRGLECVVTNDDQIAEKAINDTSDKVRDALDGSKTATVEVVVRVDGFSASTGRMFAINLNSTANASIGWSGTSGTVMQFFFNETKVRTIDPGTVRAVWHVVVDTAQGTADDRIKIYKDGSLQSPTVDANPALDATLSFGAGSRIVMFNRGVFGSRDRSFDGVLFYAALYSSAFSAANVTTNDGILGADDDTPAAGGISIPVVYHHRQRNF